jgi:hypothetical protein
MVGAGYHLPESDRHNPEDFNIKKWGRGRLKQSGFRLEILRSPLRISAGLPIILIEVICGFSQFLQRNVRKYLKLRHDHFLPQPVQFFIYDTIIRRYILS